MRIHRGMPPWSVYHYEVHILDSNLSRKPRVAYGTLTSFSVGY